MLTIKRNHGVNAMPAAILKEGRQATGVLRVTSNGKAANGLKEEVVRPTLLELSEVLADHVYDIFDVDRFSAAADETNQGYMHAFVELAEPSPDIRMKGWVRHRESGEVLCELPEKIIRGSKSCELSEPFQIEAGLTPEELLLSVEAVWYVDGQRQDVIKTVNCTLAWGTLDYIHVHPVKKEKQEDEPTIIGMKPEGGGEGPQEFKYDPNYIVSCFLRYPDQYMDIDYMVNFGRSRGHNDRPLFGIPGHGIITGPVGTTFVSGKGECCLYPRSGGVQLAASTENSVVRLQKEDWMRQPVSVDQDAKYHTYPGDITVEGFGSTAQYSMMTAWNYGTEYFDEEGGMTSHYFDFELRIDLNFIDKQQKPLPPLTLLVTSRKSSLRANYIKEVLPLRVMYGCLAKGTLVSTARGPVPIEEITIGEMVAGKDGALDRVVNVWRGEEPDGITVISGDGFELLATADHPVSVPEGMKRAGRLEEGELVITGHGPRPVHIGRRPGLTEVFNLDTEKGEPFFAGDILVGGMRAQNSRLDLD